MDKKTNLNYLPYSKLTEDFMEMKLIYTLAVLFSISSLVGCGGANKDSDKSKDRMGNCSQLFIDDYNRVTDAGKDVSKVLSSDEHSESYKLARIESLHVACENFLKAHDGVSCKATDQHGKFGEVSASELKTGCASVKKYRSEAQERKSKPSTETPTTQKPPEVPQQGPQPEAAPAEIQKPHSSDVMTSIPSTALGITVVDPSKLKSLLSEGKLMTGGRLSQVGDFINEYNNGDAICMSETESKVVDKLEIKQDESFNLIDSAVSNERTGLVIKLNFIYKSQVIRIGCFKKGTVPFSLGNIRKAFSGVLEFLYKN